MYVDLLTAYPTLDVATPVVFAVATISYNHRLGRVPPSATHRSATTASGMILKAFSVIFK
jgi:hypothetical protein